MNRLWGNASLWIELVFWGLLVVVVLWTLPDYGMSWDEPTRWRSGDLKLSYYEGFAGAESWWDHAQSAPQDLYPGLFDIPLALAARWLPFDRFFMGHLWSVVFGLSGILATRLLGRRVVSPEAVLSVGLLAAAMLILVPAYYGHLFINPKDIPFAAMTAWALLALVCFVGEFPRPSLRTTLLLGVATGLVMAVRVPGGIVFGYAGIIAGVWCGMRWIGGQDREGWWREVGGLAWRGILAGLVAVLTLLPWWPAAHRNPFSTSAGAVERLHSFSADVPVLYAGQVYEAGSTPVDYALRMFLITMPEWLLVALFLGLAALVAARGRFGAALRANERLAWQRLSLLLAALFPVVYVTWAQPAVHNGFRHMLYILPSTVVLAALALDFARRHWMAEGRRPVLFSLGLGAAVLIGCWNLIALHPYQYIYYNSLVGGTAGSFGRYETEYWFTSTRHGLEFLDQFLRASSGEMPAQQPVRVFVTGPWQVAEPFLPDGFALSKDPHQSDFIIANTQMLVHTLFEGEEIHWIHRAGLPILVVKKVNRTAE